MKLKTLLKTMALTALLVVTSLVGRGQTLLVEDFNYSAATALTANGWTAHSGAGTSPIMVDATGLSYAGYYSSNIGLSAKVVLGGEDVNKGITSQNSGSVYMAAMVNVTAAFTGGDYFLHFSQTSGATAGTFFARIFAKKDASNNLAFGISKGGTANYTGFTYSLNTTYLLVLKYTFVSGTLNDNVDLYINPIIGSPEPAATISYTDAASADPTALAGICIRQGSGTAAPTALIDGIRVATTWAEAVKAPDTPPALSSTTPADNATDVAANATLSMTFSKNIVKGTGNITIKKVSDDSAVQTIDVTSGSVSVATTTATITPSPVLEKGVEYYVTVDATCFKDASANAYAGISDKTAWTFTTVAKSTAADFTAFSFAEQTGAATITDPNIAITVANGSAINNLVATYTLSAGATAKVGATAQTSATTANNFTSPVVYTVTAEDGTTSKNWTVTVTEAPAVSNDATLSDLKIDGTTVTGFAAGTHTYNIELPYGTTVVPAVTYTVNEAHATAVKVDAGALPGSTTVEVTAQNTTTKITYTINFTLAAPKTDATLSDLKVSGTTVTGFAAATHTYSVELPYGTIVVPTVAYTKNDATATAVQTNALALPGSTTVEVTAQDGTTKITYTVTFTLAAPSTDATVTSANYVVDNGLLTITEVPFGETVATFKAGITPAANATFEVYQSDETTPSVTLATGDKLICTAQDGASKKVYVITIQPAPIGDLFISEYIEGNSNNKAVEVYNGTGNRVNLANYSVKTYANGAATATYSIALSGFLANGEVYVVVNSGSNAAILAQKDAESNITFYNGDDAVALLKGTTVIDVVGTIGTDPGTSWAVAGISGATLDHTIIRKSSVIQGNTNWTVSAGTNTTDSEWEVYPKDYVGALGAHKQVLPSAEANIVTFTVPGQVGSETIDAATYKVTVGVPFGAAKTALVPTITLSAGATVTPASGVVQDFSTNKTYTVTAIGGNAQAWTASVVNFSNVATVSSTAYTVNGTDETITTVPYQESLATFKSNITPVAGAVFEVYLADGSTVASDLKTGYKLTVTSQDLTVTKTYTITKIAPSTNATLTGITYDATPVPAFLPATLTYNVELAYGTTLTPTVVGTKTDANATVLVTPAANVASVVAADRTTTILVTAEDGTTTQTYNVVFAIAAANTDNTLADLLVDGTTVTGFAPATLTYSVVLPMGTTLVPTVTATKNHSTASVAITPAINVTGTQAERTATVAVTAQDGSVKNYTIEFSVVLPGADASLSDLKVNGTQVAGFAPLTLNYNVSLASGTTVIPTVTATSNDALATVLVTPATDLAGDLAARTTTVKVTAENGTTIQNYTVVFYVNSGDATLSDLTYDGTQVPAFAPATLDYAITLPYGTSAVPVVAATKNFANASVSTTQAVNLTGTAAERTATVVVTAEDAAITKTYTVVFSVAKNTVASVSSAVYTVTDLDGTITNIPYNATLAEFKANLTPAADATFEVYQSDEATVATDLQSGYKVVVIAQDGVTKKVYTITLNAAPVADLFFSEYLEGGSSNKAVEIYNPTGSAVDLSNYSLKKGTNGADFSTNLPLTGTLQPGETYVIANSSAIAAIKNNADLIDAVGTIVFFNGNDAVGLFKNGTLIDVIGLTTGTDPGAGGWSVAGTASVTANHTIVRKDAIVTGSTDWAASAGTDAASSQWTVYPQDNVDYIGWHIAKSSAKAISAFSLAEQAAAATIDGVNHTVNIKVIKGTTLTALVPTFTISKRATVSPASGVSQDFTGAVGYTVTAQDGTTQVWNVTVTIALSNDATISSTTYTVDNTAGTITNIPFAEVLATVKSNLTPAAYATFNIFDADGVTPATVIDNTKLVIVTAEDGTKKTYTITTNAASTDATLTGITVDGTSVASFAPATLTYNVELPFGTTTTPAVVGTKTDANATVLVTPATNVASAVAADRTTSILVTAQDGSTKTYTVVFTVAAANTDNTLSALLVDGNGVTGFAPATLTYSVVLPLGTVTVPTVSATKNHATASVVITQAQNLTGTQAERTAAVVVTAQDGSTKTYTVEFSVVLAGADASLSDLKVDGITVAGFAPLVLNYNVSLAAGTSTVPTVTATPNDGLANAVVTPATSLTGTLAERTTTIVVTAANLSTETYSVVFYVKSDDATLSNLTFNGTPVTGFNPATLAYSETLPYGTTSVPLVAATKNFANASVNTTQAINLTGTLAERTATVLVTAEDVNYTKSYTVAFSVAKNTETDITDFTVAGVSGTVDAIGHTVSVTVPFGTDVTALVPSITLSAGATVNPTSGVAQNFTNAITYTVTAEDGTTSQDWIVTVTVTTPPKSLTNTTTLAAKYYAGETINVTWNATSINSVKVEWFNGSTWSEVAASVPATDGQYALAIAANTTYSTAYKFRISNADDATLNAESAAITVIPTTTNLSDLLTLPANSFVKYTGKATVTYTRTSRNQKYIQDATGAVLIDDATTAPGFISGTYAIGEGISNIEGKIVLYNGLVELVPTATTGEKVTGNPTITPEVRTIASLTHADQCKLVKIVNFSFATPTQFDATGKFVASKNYDVTGFANTAFVFRTAFSEANYIGGQVPTTAITTVGLVGQFNAVMQITARNLADIQSAVATLADLTVNGATVTGFNAATLAYNVELPYGSTAPVIAATAVTDATLAITQPATATSQAIVVVTAQDGITTQTYTVDFTVAAPSIDATVTSTVYTVNSTDATITNVPFNETLATFKGNIIPAANATFEVYMSDGTTVATNLQSGYKVIATAQDGVTKKTYTVTLLTGIDSNEEVDVKAYPNPFSTEFIINGGKVVRNVTVSNMLGQKVMVRDYNEVVTKAFPNPFSTDFKINAGKVVRNVVVSNMLGQKVMERTYNEIEIEVPASDLRTGVYFVTVKFEDGTSSTLRMVKK